MGCGASTSSGGAVKLQFEGGAYSTFADSGSPMWAENDSFASSKTPTAAIAEMNAEMRTMNAKQHLPAEMQAMRKVALLRGT